MTRVLAMLFAAAPFAFAMMRTLDTEGRDLRYLWIAVAAFGGAMLRMAIALKGPRRMTRGALALGVFIVSTLSAAVIAFLLGTTVGPAMLVVSAGFGLCYAMSTYLRMPGR